MTPTPTELESLIESVLTESFTEVQADRLQQLLREDPAMMGAYLDQMRVHALLQWRVGRGEPKVPVGMGGEEPLTLALSPGYRGEGRSRSAWGARRWAIAAVLLLVASLVAVVVSRSRRTSIAPVDAMVAEITELHNITWADGQPALAIGARLSPRDIAIASGTLQLRSNSGAVATLSGPATVKLLSDMRLLALKGRITVRVGPDAHGFTVEAPSANVIDLGTEFGVQVDEAGQTDVLVFEGKVDLQRKPAIAPNEAATHMTKGEGLRVDAAGNATRILSVQRQPGAPDWAVGGEPDRDALITAVRDNLRDPANAKYYQIVHRGLNEDVPAYVDRSYEWNGYDTAGMPPELRGADFVMTFNSDKHVPDLELTVTLGKPAMLYVFLLAKAEPPDWIVRDFEKTDWRMGLDEGPPDMPNLALGKGPGVSIDRKFSVWRRVVREAGTVKLGENSMGSKSMYGIAATPLP